MFLLLSMHVSLLVHVSVKIHVFLQILTLTFVHICFIIIVQVKNRTRGTNYDNYQLYGH